MIAFPHSWQAHHGPFYSQYLFSIDNKRCLLFKSAAQCTQHHLGIQTHLDCSMFSWSCGSCHTWARCLEPTNVVGTTRKRNHHSLRCGGSWGELIFNSSWSPQLLQSPVLLHACRCYNHCKVGLHSDLAKLPQPPGCKASVQSTLNSHFAPGCFSGLTNMSKSHTLLLPPPNLHFLPLSSPICNSL